MIYPYSKPAKEKIINTPITLFTVGEVYALIAKLLYDLQNANKTIGSNTDIEIIHRIDCVGIDVRLSKDKKAIKITSVIAR